MMGSQWKNALMEPGLDQLQSLLCSPESVNKINETWGQVSRVKNQQWSPLHFVAYNGWLDKAKLLIKNGAKVNNFIQVAERDRDFICDWTSKNLTPLHLAIQNCHGEMIRLLLSAGADVSIRCSNLFICDCCGFWRSLQSSACTELIPTHYNIALDLRLRLEITPDTLESKCIIQITSFLERGILPASVEDSLKILPYHLASKIPQLAVARKKQEDEEEQQRKLEEENLYLASMWREISRIKEPLKTSEGKFIKLSDLLKAIEEKSPVIPEYLDVQKMEDYIHNDEFDDYFGMSRTQFKSLAKWKQMELRKKKKFV